MLALQIALGFGIALLMPLLVYYTTCSFFPHPEYPSVCGRNDHESKELLKDYHKECREF